jgi:alpha-galactosidase
MEDGSRALEMYNLGEGRQEMSATWADPGIAGTRRVRDVWRQKDAGDAAGRYGAPVNRHGVVLVRLYK